MPYVLSTALVLILGGSRQAHIRLCDLCTPPSSHPLSLLPLGGWISPRGARAFWWKCKMLFSVEYGARVPSPRTETLLNHIISWCCYGGGACRKRPARDHTSRSAFFSRFSLHFLIVCQACVCIMRSWICNQSLL